MPAAGHAPGPIPVPNPPFPSLPSPLEPHGRNHPNPPCLVEGIQDLRLSQGHLTLPDHPPHPHPHPLTSQLKVLAQIQQHILMLNITSRPITPATSPQRPAPSLRWPNRCQIQRLTAILPSPSSLSLFYSSAPLPPPSPSTCHPLVCITKPLNCISPPIVFIHSTPLLTETRGGGIWKTCLPHFEADGWVGGYNPDPKPEPQGWF